MQISPISNNNTNFQARFIKKSAKFQELLCNESLEKGITKKTLKLGKKFKEIGKGQDLEILDSYAFKDCNLNEYGRVLIKNHYTGKEESFTYPNCMPFWDGLLTTLLQDKNKEFFEFDSDAVQFYSLITGDDK